MALIPRCWAATVFTTSVLLILSSCTPESKYTSVTIETCKPEYPEFNTRSIALARVNSTSDQVPSSNRGDQLSCVVSGGEAEASQKFVTFDLILQGDSPQEINLQMANEFLPQLTSSLIVCSYSKIGKESRVNREDVVHSENLRNGTYNCNTSLARITFTGMPSEIPLGSDHVYTKRSIAETAPKCYKETFSSKEPFKKLGDSCRIDSITKTGYRYMINEKGGPDCLTCCPDHHYDSRSKGCHKCRPGTTQPKMNVWPHCEPISTPGNTPVPTESVMATSTSAQKDSTSTTKSIPTTTKKSVLKPPVRKPTGLVVATVSCNHAVILWNETVSPCSMQVRYYSVETHPYGMNISEMPEIKTKSTWVRLSGLIPQSCYEVVVRAGNRAGIGPASEVLVIHTLRQMPKVEKLQLDVSDNFSLVWAPKPDEHDLTVNVKIRLVPDNGTWWTFSKQHSSGRIQIPFATFPKGNSSMQVFYEADGQEGQKSDPIVFEIGEGHVQRKDQENGTNGWMIAFIVLFIIDIIAIIAVVVRRTRSTSPRFTPGGPTN